VEKTSESALEQREGRGKGKRVRERERRKRREMFHKLLL
jgi:hypothetical protein